MYIVQFNLWYQYWTFINWIGLGSVWIIYLGYSKDSSFIIYIVFTTFTYAMKYFGISCTTILILNRWINRLTVINVMYRATCLPLITKNIRLSIAKRYIIGAVFWGVWTMLWMVVMDISPHFHCIHALDKTDTHLPKLKCFWQRRS